MKNILLFLIVLFLSVACKKEKEDPTPKPGDTKYSISYNGNGNTGGIVPTDANTYDNGSSADILGNTGNLVKTNHSFNGWNTKADGSGTNYLPGSKLTINNSNITLYARWFLNSPSITLKITYNGNGNTSGTVPNDNASYAPGSTVTVMNNTGGLNQNGNTFKNWNTSQSGTGQTYLPGSQFSIQNNLTLYAIYNSPPTSTGKYIGFNASGQVKRKSTLTSSWITEDLGTTFGSSHLVSVVWNGSQYIGFNASGQVKRKNTLTSSWITEDLGTTFGSSHLVTAVYH